MALRHWARLTVAAATLALASPAQAALTNPVEGLEPALNAAWGTDPACRDLRVDDLVVREGTFLLTTTSPVVFRVGEQWSGPSTCQAGTWHVRLPDRFESSRKTCAQALCDLLQTHPSFAPSLSAAFDHARTADPEVAIPLHWSPPTLTPISRVWFGCALLTLLLLMALSIARWLFGIRGPDSGLQRSDWLVLGGIATAGFVLHLWLIRAIPVSGDELVSMGYDSLWREFDGRETVMNPPLYRLLSWPVAWLTNGAPEPGRLIPSLLGVALVFIVARLVALLAGRRAALVSAVLVSLHPGLVLATLYDRSYATLMVATALALLATETALRTHRTIDRYFAATCLTATFLSHYFGAAPVLGVILWIAISDHRNWRDWIGPAALGVMLCGPFVPAAFAGADNKAQAIGVVGLDHTWRLALDSPAIMAGIRLAPLQGSIYGATGRWLEFAGATLFLLIFIAGLRRLSNPSRVGLAAVTLLAWLIPIAAASRLTTVREFQMITAAVPLVVLGSAALGRSRYFPVATGVLAAIYLAILPFDRHSPDLSQVAASAIEADRAHWPIFVWGGPGEAFANIAMRAGLDRPHADLTTEGADPMIRALRSCSTAAVRDAAHQADTNTAWTMLLDTTCRPADLSGRGVQCATSREIDRGVQLLRCDVDRTERTRPGPFPSRLPTNMERRLDRAILAGHEQLFIQAASPLTLSKPLADRTALTGITIGWESVKYVLTPPNGAPLSLYASPHFTGNEITGTELATEDDAPIHDSAADQLRQSLTAHLTPAVWNEVYAMVSNGMGPSHPPRNQRWLIISAFAALVLIASLGITFFRRTRPA